MRTKEKRREIIKWIFRTFCME